MAILCIVNGIYVKVLSASAMAGGSLAAASFFFAASLIDDRVFSWLNHNNTVPILLLAVKVSYRALMRTIKNRSARWGVIRC